MDQDQIREYCANLEKQKNDLIDMVSTRYSLVDKTYIHTTPVTQSRRPVLFVQYNWTSFKGVILIYWRCTILRWNFQGLTEECPIVTVRALNSHEIYYRILGLYFENSTSHDRISRFEIFLDWEPWTVRYKPKRTFYPEIRPNLLVNCKISTLFQAIKSPKVLGILRLRNTRIILLNLMSGRECWPILQFCGRHSRLVSDG